MNFDAINPVNPWTIGRTDSSLPKVARPNAECYGPRYGTSDNECGVWDTQSTLAELFKRHAIEQS